MKKCNICHQVLEDDKFYAKVKTPYIDNACKDCRKKQAHELYLRHKKDLLENGHSKILHKKPPLLEKACTKCGEVKDISKFTYDAPRDCYSNVCMACRWEQKKQKMPPKKDAFADRKVLLAKGMQTCRICGEVKPIEEMRKRDGSIYTGVCLICALKQYRDAHGTEERLLQRKLNKEQKQKRSQDWKVHVEQQRKNTSHKQSTRYLWKCLEKALYPSKYFQISPYFGCSKKFLIEWLEGRFKDGMGWYNRSRQGWHVDHYVPISHFDLSQEEDRFICWNYQNLQPLWCAENKKKGNILPDDYLQHIEKIKKELKIVN